MQAQSDRVKAAIALCDEWYATMDYDIRTMTERIDALWLEVEHLLSLMEQAEWENDREATANALERVIYYVTRIQGQVKALSD
jgi:hypothetical protein